MFPTSARGTDNQPVMRFFDKDLGVPIREKDYGENCDFTLTNIRNGLFDLFALAHTLGWFGKAIILRDWSAAWPISQ